jgi:hypothetical protein
MWYKRSTIIMVLATSIIACRDQPAKPSPGDALTLTGVYNLGMLHQTMVNFAKENGGRWPKDLTEVNQYLNRIGFPEGMKWAIWHAPSGPDSVITYVQPTLDGRDDIVVLKSPEYFVDGHRRRIEYMKSGKYRVIKE